MHRKRSCWTRALTAVVCLAFLAAGSAAAAEKPKPAARDAPGLLDIPQVPRDQVICFALYTVHNNILKLTAQLYPLQEGEPRTVRLEVQR
ncbi:MAG: hypothetical protein IMZ55_08585, partial [Acidobacteria bacterium]|nr:hypothetical protein [Acidobacteriota bacterium]